MQIWQFQKKKNQYKSPLKPSRTCERLSKMEHINEWKSEVIDQNKNVLSKTKINI